MGFNLQTKHLKAFQPDVEEDEKKAWSRVKFHYVSQKHEKAECLNESQKKCQENTVVMRKQMVTCNKN